MRKIVFSVIALFFFVACRTKDKHEIGEKYFELYAARKDFDAFKSFYNDTIEYENVVLQTGLAPISSQDLILNNFSWNDHQMVYENSKVLTVNQLVSNDTMIVADGFFNPYEYQGMKIPAMKFTTWLFLDHNQKIKKQIDWFNYPIEDIIEAYQMRQSFNIKSGE